MLINSPAESNVLNSTIEQTTPMQSALRESSADNEEYISSPLESSV
jgi:hypothetical protein